MSKTDIEKMKDQLNKVLSFVDPAYTKALLTFHRILENEHIEWSVGGELGEVLQTVQVEPDCVEIITTKKGAEEIFLVVKQFQPKPIDFQTIKLDQNANISGAEHPIYTRSYFFDFFIDRIKVKVHGDMQYKINNWDWGDKLKFTPEHVNVTGIKIAVVPLDVKLEIYENLGWMDRVEKIDPIIKRRQKMARKQI